MSSLFDSVLSNTQSNYNNATAIHTPVAEKETPTVLVKPSSKVARDYAGRDQELMPVEKLPISSEYGDIPDKKGIFCDQKCINIVANSYQVHQPIDIYNRFVESSNQNGLEVNRVLFNKLSGGMLLSAKYKDIKIAGEKHDASLVFYTSHCGKYCSYLSLDLLRIACDNQVPTIVKNKSRHLIKTKHHARSFDIVSNIGQYLETLPALIEDYNERSELLMQSGSNVDRFVEYAIEHFKIDREAKRFDSKVNRLKDIYYNAPGQAELSDSAYKVWNAFTFHNTHELRDTKMREENRTIKNMDDSAQILVELCELEA